jgi:hypothetical protein
LEGLNNKNTKHVLIEIGEADDVITEPSPTQTPGSMPVSEPTTEIVPEKKIDVPTETAETPDNHTDIQAENYESEDNEDEDDNFDPDDTEIV